jgi:antitoxin CptB
LPRSGRSWSSAQCDQARRGTDQAALNRLRWRCRRGILENDLILTRFLDSRGDRITDAELAALESILQLNDNDLWEMLSGRQEPADRSVLQLVERLRAA